MTASADRFRALDYDFDLICDGEAASILSTALAALAVDDATRDAETLRLREQDDGIWEVSNGAERLVTAPTPGRLVAGLLEHVNVRAAASVANGVTLHGAAIADGTGDVVVLVGSSGSGKSTLSAAGVLAGWQWVAEEVSLVDVSDMAVTPFHRPIGLRRGSANLVDVEHPDGPWYAEVHPWLPPVARRSEGGQAIGIALVDRTSDDPGTEMSPAAALTALVEHVVVPDDDRLVAVFRDLDRLVRRMPVVTLGSRDPAVAVGRLADLAERWRT